MTRIRVRLISRPQADAYHSIHCRSAAAGYSLLETLVAMAIISLASTLVLINGIRLVENMSERSTLTKTLGEIESARFRAVAANRNYTLGNSEQMTTNWLDVPENWTIVTDNPIVFSKLGICSGGKVTIQTAKNRRHEYSVNAANCKIERIE